jgi:hypothetical protein
MLYGIIITALIAALIYLGRAQEKNAEIKQVVNDIEEANDVRADLERDPAADQRVRERFTRELL